MGDKDLGELILDQVRIVQKSPTVPVQRVLCSNKRAKYSIKGELRLSIQRAHTLSKEHSILSKKFHDLVRRAVYSITLYMLSKVIKRALLLLSIIKDPYMCPKLCIFCQKSLYMIDVSI